MPAMIAANAWVGTPPEVATALIPFLIEPGSLTARLIDTGRRFSVSVRKQGAQALHPDEVQALSAAPGDLGYVREVTLHLTDTPVVVARSVTRLDCERWREVLSRGARSLGFTLFGELTEVEREPLHYTLLDAAHPLYRSIAEHQTEPVPHYPARRSRFMLDDTPLLVCEAFLPELLSLL
jgi:chorismate--pyruvate lyase